MAIDVSTSPSGLVEPIPRPLYAEVHNIASLPRELWNSLISSSGTSPGKTKQTLVLFSDDRIVELSTSANSEKVMDLVTQPAALTDRLNEIKGRLDLTITQMAELFGVTRKSVYDWYEGVEPRQIKTSRMETLIDVLIKASKDSIELDLKRLKIVWNIPIDGLSFREVFNDDKLDSTSLKSALFATLHELSPRMVKSTSSVHKTFAQIGSSHLIDIDRSADFS